MVALSFQHVRANGSRLHHDVSRQFCLVCISLHARTRFSLRDVVSSFGTLRNLMQCQTKARLDIVIRRAECLHVGTVIFCNVLCVCAGLHSDSHSGSKLR
mmetsp:Transcript_55081/g.147011  ORF Transcript_55081/g.147011 Transcript_55081/m.147011 type:complete len:100 (+) Transcript_55081:2146-2445(+)